MNKMKNNALYYPYINPPKSKWLLEKLLYWDSISSIIPSQVEASKDELEPLTKDLISARLLKLIKPFDYNLSIFQSRFLEVAKNFTPSSITKTRIHIEKIGNLSYDLTELGLLKHGEYSYPWFKMNSELAFIFMKMLVEELSKIPDLNATTITDSLPQNIEKERIREDVLSFCMPLPNVDKISIDKILKFKEKHAPLIIGYRNRIEEITLNIINQDEKTRKDRFELEKSKFNEEIKELNEAISSSWKPSIERIIIPIVSTVGGYYGGGYIGSAIGFSSSIVSPLIDSFNKEKNPLSYYTSMERTF